jgi:hypothetical protein
VTRTLRFDTGEDFLEGTPVLDATEVDPEGTVGLAGYQASAALWTGWAGASFDDAGTATWEDVTAGVPSGRRFDGDADQTFSSAPAGIGLAGEDRWVVSWEADVYLQYPGEVYTLTLDAADRAFLEVLDDGEWRRVLETEGGEADGTIENGPLATWKPVRIAVAADAGAGRLTLQYGSDSQARTLVPPESLRAPATSLRGLRLVAYDDLDVVSRTEETIDASAVDHAWAGGGPDDLGLADTAAYSLSWTGQVRIDVAGAYFFHVVSSGGQRLVVDGLAATDAWGTAASDETSDAIDLGVGWHDVELAFEGGGGSISLSCAPGSVDLAGETIPPDRFRPIVSSRPGETREADGGSHAFGTGGITSVASSLVVGGPTGSTATIVDVSFRLDHDDQDQVLVEVQSPLGTRATVRDHVAGTGIRDVSVDGVPDFAGEEIEGTWRIWATDEIDAIGGVLENTSLTVHYRAPLSIYARTGAYATRVVDLTDGLVAYGEARWSADSSVEVRTRSCPTAATCAIGAWSSALADASGSIVDSDLERFLQMQARFTGDGQSTPTLDWMEMDYDAYDAACVCP